MVHKQQESRRLWSKSLSPKLINPKYISSFGEHIVNAAELHHDGNKYKILRESE